jgi:hypothetical protein
MLVSTTACETPAIPTLTCDGLKSSAQVDADAEVATAPYPVKPHAGNRPSAVIWLYRSNLHTADAGTILDRVREKRVGIA